MAKDEVTLTILGDIPLAYRTEELRGIKGTAWENFAFKHVKSGDKAPTPNDLVDVFARHAIKASEKLGVPLADFFKTVNPNPNISSAHVTMRENKKHGLKAYMSVNEQGRSGSIKMYASHSDSITGGTTVVNPSTAPHVGDMAGGGEGRGGGKKGRGTAPSVSDKVKNQHLLMYGTPSPSVLKSQEYRNFIEKNYGPRAVDFPSSFLSGSGMSVREFRAMTANEFLMQGTPRGSIQYTGKQNRQMDHNNRFVPFDAVAYKAALEEKERALKNSINRHTPIKDNSPSVSDFRFRESHFVSTNPGRHGPDATREQIYPNSFWHGSNVGKYHSANRIDYMNSTARGSGGSVEDLVVVDKKGKGGKGFDPSKTGTHIRPRAVFDTSDGHVVQSARSKGISYDASEINATAMSRIHSQPYAYSSFNKMYTGSTIGNMWSGLQNLVSSLAQPIKSGSVLSSLNQLLSGNLGSYGKYGGSAGASYASELMQGTRSFSGGPPPPPPTRGPGGPPPPPPPPPNKPPKRGGFGKQMAEQGRHAFAWGLYTAPLTAAMALGARVAIGDRFAEGSAHGLIGVGMHDQADRDKILAYGRRRSEVIPYTHPQDHINTYKEVASGLGVDPTTENIPSLIRTSNTIQTYSKYSMQEPATAARSIARQTTMVKAVAPEFKDKTNQETAEYVANVLAGIYKTSSVKGEEMDTALRYGGAALMGPKGWGWDFASTAAFSAQMIQSGVGASQIGVSAKHMATGIPFYEQAAKLELIKRKIRENAADPKIGWTRNAIPFEMTKRGYWQKPENKKALSYEASKQAEIYRSGPEAALSKLHEHATTAVKMTNMGYHMGEIVTQQMMPTFELFAQQSKGDAVGNVDKIREDAIKAAKEKELDRAERARGSEGNISASFGKISEGWVNWAAELGQDLLGGWMHKRAANYNLDIAARAVQSGDAKEAAKQYSFALSAHRADNEATSRAMINAREKLVYTGIINELKKKGASKTNKLQRADLPEKLQEYLSPKYISSSSYYGDISDLISDLPERSPGFGRRGLQQKEFKLPEDAIGGIPGRNDIKEAIELLPKKIGKEILENSPDITVNAGNGVDVSVSHSNKPATGIPAVPANAPKSGQLIWGRGGRVTTLPMSLDKGFLSPAPF